MTVRALLWLDGSACNLTSELSESKNHYFPVAEEVFLCAWWVPPLRSRRPEWVGWCSCSSSSQGGLLERSARSSSKCIGLKLNIIFQILEIGRKAFLSAFGRKIWYLETPIDSVGSAKRPISGQYFGQNTLFYIKISFGFGPKLFRSITTKY